MAATSFFGGEFFGGEFFNESTVVAETPYKGGRGDNKSGDARRGIYKPTGLVPRRTLTVKGKTPEVQKRLDQSAEIAAEVAGQLARELEGERVARETRTLTEQEVAREIAVLLQKRIRTEEDEIMLLLLMAAAAVQ